MCLIPAIKQTHTHEHTHRYRITREQYVQVIFFSCHRRFYFRLLHIICKGNSRGALYLCSSILLYVLAYISTKDTRRTWMYVHAGRKHVRNISLAERNYNTVFLRLRKSRLKKLGDLLVAINPVIFYLRVGLQCFNVDILFIVLVTILRFISLCVVFFLIIILLVLVLLLFWLLLSMSFVFFSVACDLFVSWRHC